MYTRRTPKSPWLRQSGLKGKSPLSSLHFPCCHHPHFTLVSKIPPGKWRFLGKILKFKGGKTFLATDARQMLSLLPPFLLPLHFLNSKDGQVWALCQLPPQQAQHEWVPLCLKSANTRCQPGGSHHRQYSRTGGDLGNCFQSCFIKFNVKLKRIQTPWKCFPFYLRHLCCDKMEMGEM